MIIIIMVIVMVRRITLSIKMMLICDTDYNKMAMINRTLIY